MHTSCQTVCILFIDRYDFHAQSIRDADGIAEKRIIAAFLDSHDGFSADFRLVGQFLLSHPEQDATRPNELLEHGRKSRRLLLGSQTHSAPCLLAKRPDLGLIAA